MKANQHVRDGRVRYRYPTPIAAPYRFSRIARSPVVRLGHALGTIDQTVRFLTWILLSDYLGGAAGVDRDAGVEAAIQDLARPSTERLLVLLQRLAFALEPESAFVPELCVAISGEAGDDLASLVEDTRQISIERSTFDANAATERFDSVMPRLDELLDALDVLAHVLLVRPSEVSRGELPAWYLHPWRGVGSSRPLLVHTEAAGQLSGMGTTLLLRTGRPDGLRLDPFVVPGPGGRVMGLLNAPELSRVRYEHYASGSCVEWDVPLRNIVGERDLRPWRIQLGLDPDSANRLRREIDGTGRVVPGYVQAIPTAIEAGGEHFRAIHAHSAELHNVVMLHPHLVREESFLRETVASLEALSAIDHPNVARPCEYRFDSGSATFLIANAHPIHGRLADRMPPGARLPVRWSLRCVDAVLAGLDALAERHIYPARLPAWAVSVGAEPQVVPFLIEAGGAKESGSVLVGQLLYRMLTGDDPSGTEPIAPGLLRAGVPAEVDRVVLDALARKFSTPLAMRAELRAAAANLPSQTHDEPGPGAVAVERIFAHLQRLRPAGVEALEAEAEARIEAGDAPGAIEALHRIVEALWDPDARLGWFVRLVETSGELGDHATVQAAYERLIELARDHLPTLRLAASSYRSSLRTEDRIRLYLRILHAATGEDERLSALRDLARLREELREPEQALEHWAAYAALRPRDPEGWRGLCRVQRSRGDERALAEALSTLLDTAGDPDERLDAVRELAVLRAGPLGDPAGAIDLLREVVEAGASAGVYEVLRDIARELHDDVLLAEALEGLVACEDELGERERYAVALERAIVLGLRLDDTHRAVAILDELAKTHPSDRAVLSYRAQILTRSGLWLEASGALEEWAAAETDPASLGLALKRLARVSHEHLGEAERAVQLYEGVLQTDPTDREALAFLDEAYAMAQDWPHLAAVLVSRVEVTPSREDRLQLLDRLARVQDAELGDAEAAFHTYGRLIRLDPRSSAHLVRFGELADATGGWDEARDVVEAVLPHLDPETSKSWRRRLGKMRLDHAEDLSVAVQYFRDAVAEDPEDVPSLEGLADATARIGAWEENAEALQKLVELAPDEVRRVARLHALAATLRDRVLAPRRAAAAYDKLLEIDPEDELALKSLAALGESAGRSAADRVQVLRRWVELCADPVDRLECLEDIVTLAEPAGLGGEELAVLYEDILELDPASPKALAGLAEHHRSQGAWPEMLEVLEQMFETAGSSDQPALLSRMAQTRLDDTGDVTGAVQAVERLLAEFPEAPLDLDLIERVMLAAGKPRHLADILAARAEGAIREEERAQLLFAQSRVFARRLGDEPKAVALAEQALSQNPDHLDSLQFLAEVYVRDEQWPAALRITEALVVAVDEAEPELEAERALDAWCSLGEVREKMAEPVRAGEAFEQALARDPDSIRPLVGLARVAWQMRDTDLADVRYRELLERHGASLDAEVLAHVRAALSEIAASRGDDVRSRELLEQALESRPDSQGTLGELVAVCERQSDWEGVARFRLKLAESLTDPLERFAELMELAQLYREKLKRDDDARPLLEEARELRPDSVAVPVQLLDVYLSTKRYKQAVDVLQSLIGREENERRRARYTYTLALLYRDHLHEPRKAVAFLNETLDLDSTRLEAFEALDRILVKHKDWRGQAESYRAMISRVEGRGKPEIEFSLLRNLARIYLTGLGQPREATKVLAEALERSPRDIEVREELARLYEDLEPAGDSALVEYRRILSLDAQHKGAWKALGRVYARKRNRDATWNVCGVLKLIGLAEPKEQAFYAKHQKPALALRKGLDGLGHWERYLYDPRLDKTLGRVFELVGGALGPALATKTPQELGLGPGDMINLRQRSRFTGFLGTVSKILRVPIPPVYRSASTRGIRKVALRPPAMIVGPEVLTGRKGKELRFLIGKAMTYFLPANLLAGMYPVGHLRTILVAAMRTVMPEWSQGGEPGVRGVQKMLEQGLGARNVEELRTHCVTLTERGLGPNVNEWQKQVERTANHAGHLLCDDIEVFIRMLQEERTHGHRWSKLTIEEAMSDLALYTVSDRYLALRREVGAAIQEKS